MFINDDPGLTSTLTAILNYAKSFIVLMKGSDVR